MVLITGCTVRHSLEFSHGLSDKFQTLKVESMKPIKNWTEFWMNLDEVFSTEHCEQLTGPVLFLGVFAVRYGYCSLSGV